MPNLRERPEDISVLVEHILVRLSALAGTSKPGISRAALDALQRYPFPGNVRELENILERALTLCEGDAIEKEDLRLPEAGPTDNGTDGPLALDPYLDNVEKNAILQALEQTRYKKTAAAESDDFCHIVTLLVQSGSRFWRPTRTRVPSTCVPCHISCASC